MKLHEGSFEYGLRVWSRWNFLIEDETLKSIHRLAKFENVLQFASWRTCIISMANLKIALICLELSIEFTLTWPIIFVITSKQCMETTILLLILIRTSIGLTRLGFSVVFVSILNEDQNAWVKIRLITTPVEDDPIIYNLIYFVDQSRTKNTTSGGSALHWIIFSWIPNALRKKRLRISYSYLCSII